MREDRGTGPRARWFRAIRVAAVATAVVVSLYVLGVLVLDAQAERHLTAEVDARLSQRLHEAAARPLPAPRGRTPADADRDFDDAPTFEWTVPASGVPEALTPGAPALPARDWGAGAVTLTIGGAPFRVQSAATARGTLLAGQSIAQVARVQGALFAPELALGLLLVGLTFTGALVVGLRVSAPLEAARRRQAEFTADASHELRTPLSVIEAEVDLALSRPRRPKEYEAVLRRVAGEGARLRRIVEDLLWLARLDERAATEPREVTDVASVVSSSVARFQPVAAARGVDLLLEPDDPGPAPVLAGHGWVDRLLGVLIDNACKFAGRGGTVTVAVTVQGNRVLLRVEDTGPGIPPEIRSSVLGRFHRGLDHPEGAGLGLAIADSVVAATNGTWQIGDRPEGGARIVVGWRRAGSRAEPADGTTSDRARSEESPCAFRCPAASAGPGGSTGSYP